MSVRLFNEFQKKHNSASKGSPRVQIDSNLCIAIPLKSTTNSKPKELDENFIKVVEYEYAVRYLERMGVEANAKNIQRLLRDHPLSSCELSSGWNNAG